MEIVLAFRDADGGYIRHVGAMLASVLHCTARPMRLHVLHDETLTFAGREALSVMVRRAGRKICFHPLVPSACLPGVDEKSPIMEPLTFATLYRLFIPAMPDLRDCERVVYLDTDLVAEADLGELWDMDMGPALLGAVPDPYLCGALQRTEGPHLEWSRNMGMYNRQLGIPTARYFNAGVLLLRLKAICGRRLFEEALDMVLRIPQLTHPDQDALNKVFFEHSTVIPKKFNYLLHHDDVSAVSEGVWHYTGARKPWKESGANMPKADRYRHYLARTPWGRRRDV